MSTKLRTSKEIIWSYLNEVSDPEIPVINIVELGIVRDLTWDGDQPVIHITPTYSGCPAMDVISEDVLKILHAKGFASPQIKQVLSPAWTTAWITDAAKQKLSDFGIAPPEGSPDKGELFGEAKKIACPLCRSRNTKMISLFGSTACKSHYSCNDCQEPFDYFKCL